MRVARSRPMLATQCDTKRACCRALGATMNLSDRWLLKAGGRYGRLLGEVADSPVIETENQLSGVLGLGYRFDLPQ